MTLTIDAAVSPGDLYTSSCCCCCCCVSSICWLLLHKLSILHFYINFECNQNFMLKVLYLVLIASALLFGVALHAAWIMFVVLSLIFYHLFFNRNHGFSLYTDIHISVKCTVLTLHHIKKILLHCIKRELTLAFLIKISMVNFLFSISLLICLKGNNFAFFKFCSMQYVHLEFLSHWNWCK